MFREEKNKCLEKKKIIMFREEKNNYVQRRKK